VFAQHRAFVSQHWVCTSQQRAVCVLKFLLLTQSLFVSQHTVSVYRH